MASPAVGLWYDYSEPAILDATLTLSVRNGNYLISALTFLATLAATSFWNITAFILHARKVRGAQATAIGLQQQVSLRNTSGAGGTLWQVFKVARAWSGRSPSVLRRTCSVAIIAALVWAAFAAASVFVSRVANKNYENAVTRVRASDCGFWGYDVNNPAAQSARNTKVLNDTIQARTYMTNFYANTSQSPTTRSLFIRPTLPFNTSSQAPCPVTDAERCVLGYDGGFSMTTDFLDSQEMLGINAKASDRITLQISVTCSPIHSKGLTYDTNINNGTFLEFDFGPIPGISNSTYLYNLLTPGTDAGYLLVSRYALAQGGGVWTPIPDFNRTDVDLSVYFLSQNNIAYSEPVFDPWFSANGTYTRNLSNQTYYLPDYLVNALICADQFVVCNPTTNICTTPAGLVGIETQAVIKNQPGFNPAQLATAGRIILALTNSNTFNSVIGLGPSALFANNFVFDDISAGLPVQQWQAEVLGWFQTSLAKLQAYVVEYASNTGDLGSYGSISSPYNAKTNTTVDAAMYAALQHQCTNQLMMVTGEVQNFSFLGVMIIVCVTVTLVIIDWSLESIVECLEKCRGRRDSPAARARQTDDVLHLLRMAMGLPETGEGTWQLGKWKIPVSNAGGGLYDRPTEMGRESHLSSYPHNLDVHHTVTTGEPNGTAT